MSHTVTVTKLPDEQSDDVEYTISGEHDDQCEMWIECFKSWHRHPRNDYGQYGGYDEWSTKRVPVVHQWIDGSWMVPSSDCSFRYAFENDNPDRQMTDLGIYDARVDWVDDWWIAELSLRQA